MTNRNLIALLIVAALAACGGGGGGSIPSGVSSGGGTGGSTGGGTTGGGGSTGGGGTVTEAVSFTITIPKKTTSSSISRAPQYIPSNTGSLTMTLLSVNGTTTTGTAQGPFDLTPGAGNSNCTAGSNGTTCTFQISAPVGTDIFLATTYASSNGTGSSLGSGSVLLSVAQNARNTASLTLTGPVASVQVVSSVTTLQNANQPIDSDSVARRQVGNVARKTASGTRSPAGTSYTPSPITPVTTSRIFVIALDAQGNQIINPTTFDIPIQLQLALNGLPVGTVTLGVTYAGLPGEPTTAASTTADAGTVTVYAPSDVVTLSLTGTTLSYYNPTVTALYTPQGGTAQTSAPLTYSIIASPPSAFMYATANHTDPVYVNVQTTLSLSVGNLGTAATTGSTTALVTPPGNANYVGDAGSDPSWTCVNDLSTYGYVSCTTNASIAPNASLPLLITVVPTTSGSSSTQLTAYNDGSSNYEANASDSITVNSTASPSFAVSVTPSINPFYKTVQGDYAIVLTNVGTASTTGTTTLVDTLPANVTYNGYIAPGWTCTSAAPTVTCTLPTALAQNASNTVTLEVTPGLALSSDSSITNLVTASGGGAASAVATTQTTVVSPIQFTGTSYPATVATGIAFTSGDNATLDFGIVPPTEPYAGSISISDQTGFTGNYTVISDTCSGSIIDTALVTNLVSISAAGSTPVSFGMNIIGTSNATCALTIQDALLNTATLNVQIESTSFTVQGKARH